MAAVLFCAVACQNPEDNATTINDSTPGYSEDNTQNTPPGVTSPDTTGAPRMDSSATDSTR